MPKRTPSPDISKCCHAPLLSVSGDEGTGYYLCTKCKRGADPYVAPTPVQTYSNLRIWYSFFQFIWHCIFRRLMLVLIGILLTLAFFKLRYDIHSDAVGNIILYLKG